MYIGVVKDSYDVLVSTILVIEKNYVSKGMYGMYDGPENIGYLSVYP